MSFVRQINGQDDQLLQKFELKLNNRPKSFFGLVKLGRDTTIPHSQIINYKYDNQGFILGCFDSSNQNLLGYIGVGIKQKLENNQNYAQIFALTIGKQEANNLTAYNLLKEAEIKAKSDFNTDNFYYLQEIPEQLQQKNQSDSIISTLQQFGFEKLENSQINQIESYINIRDMAKVRSSNSLKVSMDNNITGVYKHIQNFDNIPQDKLKKMQNHVEQNTYFTPQNTIQNISNNPKYAGFCVIETEDGNSTAGCQIMREDRIFEIGIQSVLFLKKIALFCGAGFNNFMYGLMVAIIMFNGFFLHQFLSLNIFFVGVIGFVSYLLFSGFYGQMIEYVQNQQHDYIHVLNLFYTGNPEYKETMIKSLLQQISFTARKHACLTYQICIDQNSDNYQSVEKCKDILNISGASKYSVWVANKQNNKLNIADKEFYHYYSDVLK